MINEPTATVTAPLGRNAEAARLVSGAAALGLKLSAVQIIQLQQLLDELEIWSGRYNLTAIRERDKMVTHHLFDSLSIHAHVTGQRVADVGTGAGFPGLPLAIVQPDRQFMLIDASAKKLRFVEHAAKLLALANVQTLHARVETLRDQTGYDCVITRAFATLPEMLKQLRGLCGRATTVLAMKGRRPEGELQLLNQSLWQLQGVERLAVPELDAERHLLQLRPLQLR